MIKIIFLPTSSYLTFQVKMVLQYIYMNLLISALRLFFLPTQIMVDDIPALLNLKNKMEKRNYIFMNVTARTGDVRAC